MNVTDRDLQLFSAGRHGHIYAKLGAHAENRDGRAGTHFAVWAPHAEAVSVIGDFNDWEVAANPLQRRDESGVWAGFVAGAEPGAKYKFSIAPVESDQGHLDKSDPFGFYFEGAPSNASIVWDLAYDWGDGEWMAAQAEHNGLRSPISVYEVHLGSWRRVPEEGGRTLTYREMAPQLADYVLRMNFTHVEFLPVMEHPFYGSWGYQTTGYFAPTSRYGTPQDFMYLVDTLHQRGIGVILDWVPSHFPDDPHGLAEFDGMPLYEPSDAQRARHPQWHTRLFDYSRGEVRSFLFSSAMFWLETYHADALRVDAVASMLYLDFGRKPGEWTPNEHGGRENLEAIAFLKQWNEQVYAACPAVQTIAEESSAWPMVSRPTYVGGLGFGMKWDMGWMHDTLQFFRKDPIHRRFHHTLLTFRGMYMFNENYALPLSHDEVKRGQGSLLDQVPGDTWRKFANLRLLYGYMFSQPGKKLLFMGDEFGQVSEWNHERSLDWHLTEEPLHAGLQRWVEDLNRFYREHPGMYEDDFTPTGFEWIDANDTANSVLSYMRRGRTPPSRTTSGGEEVLVVVCNFTPEPHYNYRIGVPHGGHWRELMNSDATLYGGSGQGNMGGVEAAPVPSHGRPSSLVLTLPPLAMIVFTPE